MQIKQANWFDMFAKSAAQLLDGFLSMHLCRQFKWYNLTTKGTDGLSR